MTKQSKRTSVIPTLRTKCEGYNPVQTKVDFVRRYQAGEFGNRAPTWDTYEEFKESGYKGLVHIRNRVAGGPTWYDVPWDEVWYKFCECCCQVDGSSLYFSGMAPTATTSLQGEVRQSERYLDLYYSTVPKPMRASLLEGGRQVYGILALSLLRTHMDASSFDWTQELLERYPGHVIEFSCYGVNWGTIPNRNTILWEVRNY